MAFNLHNLEEVVNELAKKAKSPHGRLLTLSRYTMNFDAKEFNSVCQKCKLNAHLSYDGIVLDDKRVFAALGFSQIDALDYSNFEGADITHDLNNVDLPAEYCEKYDYVLDGGTLEHVYNVPAALECVYKMLKPNGTFYFDSPVFFGINHGFYNFSPSFFYDYFSTNKYTINNLRLYQGDAKRIDAPFSFLNISMDDLCTKDIDVVPGKYYLLWGSVTKTHETTCDAVPQQSIFLSNWPEIESRNKRANDAFSKADTGAVYFYGTGLAAKSIVGALNPKCIEKLETAGGMLSLSPEEIGRHFMYNIMIFDVSKVKPGDTIIIASRINQKIIFDRIKHLVDEGVTIVKLY